jgi:nucleotide-binding universal stress UspA family protein
MIAETGILRDFPGRTVADLYLWSVEHRRALEEELGQEIRTEAAARHLVDIFSPKTRRIASRFGSRIWRTIIPPKLQTGPPAGQWREERLGTASGKTLPEVAGRRLFKDILVTISGKPDGWAALEQALEIARREAAQLNGLHVLQTEAQRGSSAVEALEAEFNRRCAQAGVTGKLITSVGNPSNRIWEQSRWNDLVVANLTYPAPPQPFAELGAGFRSLVQRCSRPLLAVPRRVSSLEKALLAYDGSPKAREALYVAAYLAGQWQIGLVVITALENSSLDALTGAWQYLETHDIPATYVKASGPAIQEILITSEEQGCDLLIMGGHSHNRALDMVLGNTVDQVLREAHKPMLICR